MKVSISFATIRAGWIENTFKALGAQTLPHRDWELVFIDDWGDRGEEVEKLAKDNCVNLKYMQSKPYHWKSNRQLGNARNTGFIHSDGELIVFLDDYTWIPETFLQRHWEIYRETRKAVIGRVRPVKYNSGPIKSLDGLEVMGEDERFTHLIKVRRREAPFPNLYAWFYTFNCSAPLASIVKVNGYDEEYDCTGEDDIDLGTRLMRTGMEFTYRTEPGITAYHMQHGGKLPINWGRWAGRAYLDSVSLREINMPQRFRDDEVHKVPKELYGTKYDGSWGLLERNARRLPWEVNQGYFSLKEARENRVKYPVKEWRYGV